MQERNSKLEAEFAVLADYMIINKLLALVKDGRIHKNDDIVNKSICKFIQRICDYISAEWIFF